MASATISLPGVTVSTPAPTGAVSPFALPNVTVTTPDSAQPGLSDIITLPRVSVASPTSRSAQITLPVVFVTQKLTRAVITLPRVAVASPQQKYAVPAGQLHMGADGVWRPFIVAHLGADGVWRNLEDGVAITTPAHIAGTVPATVTPNV